MVDSAPMPRAELLAIVKERVPCKKRGPGRSPGPQRKGLDLANLPTQYLHVLAELYQSPETATLCTIAIALGGTTVSTAHDHVQKMIAAGLVRRGGPGRRDGYATTLRGLFVLAENLGLDPPQIDCPACQRAWPCPDVSSVELVTLEEAVARARAGTLPEPPPPAPPVPDGLDAGCVLVLRADRDLGRHAGEAGRAFFPPPDLAFDDRRLLAYAEGYRAGRAARREREQNPV